MNGTIRLLRRPQQQDQDEAHRRASRRSSEALRGKFAPTQGHVLGQRSFHVEFHQEPQGDQRQVPKDDPPLFSRSGLVLQQEAELVGQLRQVGGLSTIRDGRTTSWSGRTDAPAGPGRPTQEVGRSR